MRIKWLVYIIGFALLSVIFYTGCEKGNITGNGAGQIEIKIPETTQVIDQDALDELISISNSDTLFEFNQTDDLAELVQAGNIIVADVSDKAPNGFLRRIDSTAISGGRIIAYTSQASLSDAIESGNTSVEKVFTATDLVQLPKLPDGIRFNQQKLSQGGFELLIDVTLFEDPASNTSVKMVGSVVIEPSFNFSLHIEDNRLQELLFVNTTITTSSIELVGEVEFYSIEQIIEIARWSFQPITIFVGPVPVVIQPLLTIDISMNGSATAEISFGVERIEEHTAGLRFQSGIWEQISEPEVSYDYSFNQASIGTSIKGSVGPQLNLLLYGIAGPYAKLNAFLDFETSSTNPWWALYAGLEFGVGVQVRVLDKQITDYYVPAVISLRSRLAAAEGELTGIVGGTVLDALTQSGIPGVEIEFKKNDILIGSAITDANGFYSLEIRADTGYEVLFKKAGYITAVYGNVEVLGNASVGLETILQIDVNYSGNGDFGGFVYDALTGLGVSNLSLSLRDGVNSQDGEILRTTTTIANGSYLFSDVPAGNYTIETGGSGYETAFFTAISIGGQSTGSQNGTVTPQLSENEYRVILTWGATPSDLDAHITGPSPDGNRFHIFFANQQDSGYVILDRDDITSYGPETITLFYTIGGRYRYSIHNYSDRRSLFSLALSQSNAQVRVYKGSELKNVFYVPANKEGTLWTVFEMFDDTIIPINDMTYELDPSDIQGPVTRTDAHLIRNLPKK